MIIWTRLSGGILLSMCLTVGTAGAVRGEPNEPASSQRHSIVCTEQYAPVCGRIGQKTKTYSNACFARGAGATVIAEGPCGTGSDHVTPK